MRKLFAVLVAAAVMVAWAVMPVAAQTPLERGSVGSREVKNQDLKSWDLDRASVGKSEIKEAAVAQHELRVGSVGKSELSGPVKDLIAVDLFLDGVESDGPYPSATQLADSGDDQGANSTQAWTGDNGATLQQSWVRCPDGKVALGGGYGDNDGAGQDGLNVVTSAPVQIDGDGKLSSDGPPPAGAYEPIDGDAAGSYVPNGWLVEGYNHNPSGQIIVRPHVVCAQLP